MNNYMETLYPLSPAQQRIWYSISLETNIRPYHLPECITLTGKVNINALRRAFLHIVRQHESLRSSFVITKDGPKQKILLADAISLESQFVFNVIQFKDDAENTSQTTIEKTEDTQSKIRDMFNEFIDSKFNLIQGDASDTEVCDLPIRVLIIEEKGGNDTQYHLCWVIHHIASDEWSGNIIRQELVDNYKLELELELELEAVYVEKEDVAEQESKIDYVDFTLWQQDLMATPEFNEKLQDFSKYLKGNDFKPLLPTDYSRSDDWDFKGRVYTKKLTKELTASVRDFAREEKVTEYQLLLCVFALTIARISDNNDIIIASPFANRHYPGVENMVGVFVNALPVRIPIKFNASFRQQLQEVRKNILKVQELEDVPFDSLVRNLTQQQCKSEIADKFNSGEKNPIFQLLFQWSDSAISYDLPDIMATEIRPDIHSSKFDISLFARSCPDGLSLEFEYASSLFRETTVSSLATTMAELLSHAIASPDKSIASITPWVNSHWNKLCSAGRGPRNSFPVNSSLIDQFFRTAIEHPSKIALTSQIQDKNNQSTCENISYQNLATEVQLLAQHIKEAADSANKANVIIALEESAEAITTILATLYNGYTYIPVQPGDPIDRIKHIVQETRPAVLATSTKFYQKLQTLDCICINIDSKIPVNKNSSTCIKPPNIDPENTAYIIYTSGSTGKPKGVPIRHSQVQRLFLATQSWAQLSAKDVMILAHSLSFDFSVWEIWSALLYGARLVVAHKSIRQDPYQLRQLLAQQHVTVLNQTPSAFYNLIEVERQFSNTDKLPLRLIIFGGEALDPHRVSPWTDRYDLKDHKLVNMYGITETTVHVTHKEIDYEMIHNQFASNNIGYPIDDLDIYILDKNNQLAPPGAIGQISVAGPGVTEGYIQNEDLSRQRFISNPFSQSDDDTILYLSGDLARIRPKGGLQYLGRMDKQVQIRGYRIETGEIEFTLLSHYAVSQAIVLIDQNTLIAFVVPENHQLIEDNPVEHTRNIRIWNQNKLREYMRPQIIIWLSKIPVNKNGKIDEALLLGAYKKAPPKKANNEDKALKIIYNSLNDQGIDNTINSRSLSGIENKLFEYWKAILPDGINITPTPTQNFFLLGGHSLLAARLSLTIMKTFSIHFSVAYIFKNPTLETQAKLIKSLSISEGPKLDNSEEVLRSKYSDSSHYPIAKSQLRLWMMNKILNNPATYHIPIALEFKNPLSVKKIQQAINLLSKKHPALRSKVEFFNGQVLQTETKKEIPAILEIIDLRGQQLFDSDNNIQEIISPLFSKPFPAHGPYFRSQLIRISGEKSILLLTLHHLVCDEWSENIILKDLQTFYETEIPNSPEHIPQLNAYKEHAIWEQNYLHSENYSEQLAYWKNHLAIAPHRIDWPANVDRPSIRTHKNGYIRINLPNRLGKNLRDITKNSQSTLFSTFLSAYGLFLLRYTQMESLLIGVPSSNRPFSSLENVVGCFVNILPVLFKDKKGICFENVINDLHEQVIAALENALCPLDSIIDALSVERVTDEIPLIQTTFGLTEEPPTTIYLEGQSISPSEVKLDAAKFDLALLVKCQKGSNNFTLNFNYDEDIFDETSIKILARSFIEYLTQLLDKPKESISQLSIVSTEDKQKLYHYSQDEKIDSFPNLDVISLIKPAIEQFSEHIAVEWSSGNMTYRQLWETSQIWAKHLSGIGLVPGDTIMTAFGISQFEVIIRLAVMHAGCTFIPLVEELPQQRIEKMIRATNAKVIITHDSSCSSYLNMGLNIDVIGTTELKNKPLRSLPKNISEDSAAYIMFTSGSTGEPKGIAISHKAYANLLQTVSQLENCDENERRLIRTKSSFDPTVKETLISILTGGTMVIPNKDELLNPISIIEAIKRLKITSIIMVPSLLSVIIDANEFSSLSSLEKVFIGGEAFSESLEEKVKANLDIQLFNFYGPAECTVDNIVCISYGEQWAKQRIGTPLPGNSAFLLDKEGRLVPPGVPGELHLGGKQLALGYIKNGKRTNESFISSETNPALVHDLKLKNQRLYKTGDLCYWDKTGKLVFLGRNDRQLKVRGQRFEPSEVERKIEQYIPASNIQVMIKKDSNDEPTLFACLTPEKNNPDYCSISDYTEDVFTALESELKKSLPNDWIPRQWIVVDQFPMTINAKIDQKALEREKIIVANSSSKKLPQSTNEKLIISILEILIHRSIPYIDSDFFCIGGNSLLAIRFIHKISEEIQINIPLRMVFEFPKLQDLAREIDRFEQEVKLNATGINQPQKLDYENVVSIKKSDTNRVFYPPSFSQERAWFEEKLNPGETGNHITIAYQLDGELHQQVLLKAAMELCRRQISLRLNFIENNGNVELTISKNKNNWLHWSHKVIPQIVQDSEENIVENELRQEEASAFNLQEGPLLRFHLLEIENKLSQPNTVYLFISIHHIVFDGWSMIIFLKELGLLYDFYLNKESDVDGTQLVQLLPEPPINFCDYALWQRTWLNDNVIPNSLRWWTEQFQEASSTINLPIDFQRPTNNNFHLFEKKIHIDNSLIHELDNICQKVQASTFMGILAIFSSFLQLISNQNDITIGTPAAGRQQDTDKLIGFFVNALPIRIIGNKTNNLFEVISQVRLILLDSMEKQEIPIEKLINTLELPRFNNRNPLYQVWFNYAKLDESNLQNTDLPSDMHINFSLDGLRIKQLSVEHHHSPFELSLYAYHTEQGLECSFRAAKELFSENTIEMILNSFQLFFHQAIKAPDERISSLEFEPEMNQRESNLLSKNNNQKKYNNLHEIIFNKLTELEKSPVLFYNGKVTTAQELHSKSKSLAISILNNISTEEIYQKPIAFQLDRNPDTIALVLAILSLGASYAPINPNTPVKQASSLVNEISPGCFIHANVDDLTNIHCQQLQIHDLLENKAGTVPSSQQMLPTEFDDTHPASLLHTSSSSGSAKIVELSHSALLARIDWYIQEFPVETHEHCIQRTALTFVDSHLEIFASLLQGIPLFILPDPLNNDPFHWHDHLGGYEYYKIHYNRNKPLGRCFLTPSLLNVYMENFDDSSEFYSPSHLFVGGEPFKPELIKKTTQTLTDCTLVNLYGTTESPTSLFYRFDLDDSKLEAPVLGFVPEYADVILINEWGNMCLPGTAGQICVSSKAMANGYYQKSQVNSELTISAFSEKDALIPHRFVTLNNKRWFCTGDIGHLDGNNRIRLLGRDDQQINIHGLRVFPQEIENLLEQHSDIHSALVLQEMDNICAYVVVKKELDHTNPTWRGNVHRYLSKHLPYMIVPKFLVTVASLSKNQHGKLDPSQLPEPLALHILGKNHYQAPSNTLETYLATLFHSLLEIDKVGILDDFFKLGGHSLLAVKLISAIQRKYPVEIPLRAVFDNRTIKELAELIETAPKKRANPFQRKKSK